MMFPMMSKDLARDDLVEDADHGVETLFLMNLSSTMLPIPRVKDVMSRCGGVVSSSMASRPLGSSGLCYHVK